MLSIVVLRFLVIPLICTVTADLGNSDTIYVIPDDQSSSSQCPSQRCCTFNELINKNGRELHFKTNTTIVLLSGNHVVMDESDVLVENIRNLHIMGTTQKNLTTRIMCTKSFGISFTNITNLTIIGLNFIGCGAPIVITDEFKHYEGVSVNRTLWITYSNNVTVKQVTIVNGTGIGLLFYNVYHSGIISNSHFSHNDVNCYVNYHRKYDDILFTTLTVEKSNFTHGNNGIPAAGLSNGVVVLFQDPYSLNSSLSLKDLNILHNSIYLETSVNTELHRINSTLDSSKFADGYGLTIGFGVYYNSITIADSFFEQSCIHVKSSKVTIVRTTIDGCLQSGLKVRGNWIPNVAIEDITIRNTVGYMFDISDSEITIRGTVLFHNNTGTFYAFNSHVTFYENSNVQLMGNNIKCNTRIISCPTGYCEQQICSTLLFDETQIEAQGDSLIQFSNNIASGSGGMTLTETSINFTGNSTFIFEDNAGYIGGGIELYKTILITSDCSATPRIKFIRNRAREKGGAMYVHKDFSECSFGENILWEFTNNTALIAGSAIYGNIGSWFYELNFAQSSTGCDNLYTSNHFHGAIGDISVITSDPTRVCMCVESVPNCNITNYTAKLFPGQMFEMEAVAVGLQYGASPSVVQAEYDRPHYSWKQNKSGQYLQHVEKYCSLLKYDIFISSIQMQTLTLTVNYTVPSIRWVQNHKNDTILLKDLVVTFKIKKCSLGFTLNVSQPSCICQQTLIEHGIQCDMRTLMDVIRPSPKWIKATFSHAKHANESGVIVHDHCPFDYCVSDKELHLDLRYLDKQCAFNRSGVLCGECQTNFSQVFGTSRCKQCSSLWLLLLPLFALAGVALVVFLMLLNLTVAVGTINGLIFYANIVRANHAIFFPPQTTNSFLSWFIAWLNLDLGIETCFYDGLDAYDKTWLQFVFPFYIWFIVISIIVLCRYSTTLARLCGNNAVHVLATLFLLSYAKLNRTIITMFQPTTLEYPDGYVRRVWLYDGNVDYLKGKHIPLFIAGMLVLVLLSIPYTTILFTIQWLQRYTKYRFFPWVYNLKPVFDAYIGPYKDKHRYWTGLLLLVRVILFLIFSLNVFGDPSINLLAVILTSFCLLAYLLTIGSVYKTWPLHLVESSFIFNIGVLSSATLYIINSNSQNNRKVVTFISTTITFITFVLICCYHVLQRVLPSKCGQQAKNVIMSLNFKCKSDDESPLNDGYTPFQMEPIEFDSPQVTETVLDLRKSQLGSENTH